MANFNYNYLHFSKDGFFRGFALGISLKEFSKETRLIAARAEMFLPVQDTSKIPKKFLEGHYHKVSTDSLDFNEAVRSIYGIR